MRRAMILHPLLLCLVTIPGLAGAGSGQITIFHTNDLHASFLPEPARWREDRAMINTILSLDGGAFFQGIQQERDRRNVCGVPALYTLLRVTHASEGKLLRYEQAVDQDSQSVVSFMSGAFYNP